MNLTIDIGNSQTKAAIFDGDELKEAKHLSHFSKNDLEALFSQYTISHSILASVAGLPADIEHFLRDYSSYLEMNEHTPLPFNNQYETPQTLGKDRIAGVAGASFLYSGKNVLVIDAGTCITYDFIDQEKEYAGGSISPGLNMRFRALHDFTEKLPLVEKEEQTDFIGNNTKTSILTGVLHGAALEMEGFIALYQNKYPDLTVILTGGDAPYFERQLKNRIFAVPNLVLYGLNYILNYNVDQK